MFLLKGSCIRRGFFYAVGHRFFYGVCCPGIGSFVIFYFKEDFPGYCIDGYYSIRSRYHQLGNRYGSIGGINSPHIIDQPPAFPGNVNSLHASPGIGNGRSNARSLKYSAVAVNISTSKGKGYRRCLYS